VVECCADETTGKQAQISKHRMKARVEIVARF